MDESTDNFKLNIYFKKNTEKSLPLFTFGGLSKQNNLLHFVTSRHGGCSQPPFHSLNLAFHVGDDENNVLKNRLELANYLDIPISNFTISNQVHGNHVAIIDKSKKSSGSIDISTAIKDNDAMITQYADICLLIFVADCVPVFLYDNKKKIIGLVHAGWKGTVDLITQKTVNLMRSYFGSSSQDIMCAIGPSIGPCCYQVGPEVIKRAKKSFQNVEYLIQNISEDGKGYFNLWEANKRQLLNCQIPEENIEIAGSCTCCNSDTFFSSRKDKGHTGRFAAGIMMKK
ncbi:MAG: peptidoglycan editing factor PgeF [Atribacterota bacterium]|jgi:hypothetical protein|nr:peptidoglycan editing factor PgeF [Atribacterota bacterium]MDD4289098.1 peptidoglycan editing factor PgeF [Atribacterota bacterium]